MPKAPFNAGQSLSARAAAGAKGQGGDRSALRTPARRRPKVSDGPSSSMMNWSTRAKEEKYGTRWEKHKLVGGSCGKCGIAFSLLSIRHHCRKCGLVICTDCQHSERMLVQGSTHEKIVCQVCAAELSGTPSTATDMTSPRQGDRAARGSRGVRPDLDIAEFTYRCSTCGEMIAGQTVTLADGCTRLHPECFVCCVDSERIQAGYAEKDGNIYCAEHYEELFCDTCRGCSQKITEGLAVEALGSSWHSGCFICEYCSSPLSVGSSCSPSSPEAESKDGDADKVASFNFYFHNGAVYCAKDYLEHLCNKCSGCGFAVDAGLKAMGASWHQECFVCTECKEPFAHMTPPAFCVVNGRPYCERHRAGMGSLMPEESGTLSSLHCWSPRATSAAPSSILSMPATGALERGACLSHGIAKAHEPDATERSMSYGSSLVSSSSRLHTEADKKNKQLHFEGCDGYKGPFDFEVFAQEIFKDLRQNAFGVSDEEYRNSIGLRPLEGGGKGEGKSGNLFFFSADRRYIVKTCDNDEVLFFQTCLRDYHRHMLKERDVEKGSRTRSFLPRFFGYYQLKFKREPVLRVVVMANVFPTVGVKEKYDLKGVLGSGRFVSEDQQREGVSVLKDRNFMSRTMRVGSQKKGLLKAQLGRDVKFLQDHGRVDYSLLLGIVSLADAEVHGPPQGWPTMDCNGLQSVAVSHDGGLRPGDEVFFMGIIDILEEYTVKKAVEGVMKTLRHQATHITKTSPYACKANAVSAVSASQYGKRFLDFLSGRME